jgi:tRNA wybutosine-synthesizing protein 3
MFDSDKRICLAKEDHSKKGGIDDAIQGLLDRINRSPDLYTTSSCAGRIVLLEEPRSAKKDLARWIYVTHESINIHDLRSALEQSVADIVWLRMEPFIVHVRTRDLESAKSMLSLCHTCGLKRSSVISLHRKVMMEIIGNECLDAPVRVCGRTIVHPEYLSVLCQEAERKLSRSRGNMARFQKLLGASVFR